MTKYTATSLDEIADTFDVNARAAESQAVKARTQKDRSRLRTEAATWRAATLFLRATELVPHEQDTT